ncbi:hypothetical protein [Deinococcus sonorensis]|uniref:PEGA domain-containing protein n=2 Tax=Deinococcus sonorensis TaxID=309891 RepID=A0AAU7UCN6_9DEIO
MRTFGPYVVLQPLPGLDAGATEGPVQALRAVDRLSGMPALLYLLPPGGEIGPVPDSAWLLPLTDTGREAGQPYALTELSPLAAPASNPEQTARGALEALAALHAAGRPHGGVGPAQLWLVDGQVRLAGAGLPWRAGVTPQDDLRDLAATLDHLGVRPAALQRLEQLSAQEALDLLNAPPPPPRARPMRRAQPTREAPASSVAVSPQPQPVSAPPEPVSPVVEVMPPPIPVQERPQASPVPDLQDAAPQPLRGAAEVIVIGEPDPAETTLLADPRPAPAAPPVIPEPIRIGFDDLPPFEPPPPMDFLAEAAPVTAPPPTPPVPVEPAPRAAARTPRNEPVRIGWEEDHSWRVVKAVPGSGRPSARRTALPLAVAGVLVLLGAGYWGYRSASSAPAVAAVCCDVPFQVSGAAAKVQVTVEEAPAGSALKEGSVLGTAPGTLHFPDTPGPYRLRLSAPGYAPMYTVVRMPSSAPVRISLK